MVTKKLYVHFEEEEPNFTSPFPLEPTLTFAGLAEQFCSKYNAKHSATRQLTPPGVFCKVGSKIMSPDVSVAEHVNAGDDVFIVINKEFVPSGDIASSSSQSSSRAPVPDYQPAIMEKKLKVYVHYEIAASAKDSTATQMFLINDANMSVGTLIKEFVETYNKKRGGAGEDLDAMTLCARTDSEVVVGAYDKVASKFKNNDDIWLVPIDIAIKEDNAKVGDADGSVNPIEASKMRAKDKSYYYWALPKSGEAPAPIEAPKQIRKREAKIEELIHFKTITSYSFENADPFVKVYISLPEIGQHPKEKIECDWGDRSFSLRIMDYKGFNHRLQVPKLSEEIVPEESSYKALKDSIVLRLKKVKKDHHWFELHKTKGIGED